MQEMKEKRDRGVVATGEGIEKLRSAKANQRDGSGKPWTYADIACAAGLDEKTVGRFLRQEQRVDESSARAICQSLDVDVNEVIDFNSHCEQKDRKGKLDNNCISDKKKSQSAQEHKCKNDQDQSSKKQVERLVITLDGMAFEKFIGDNEIQAALSLLLQKASGDTSVKFEKIEEGSIKITLSGSSDGLERLLALIQSGELGELRELEELGLSIEDAKLLVKNAKEQNEGVDDGNATQIDIENLKSALFDTSNQENKENPEPWRKPDSREEVFADVFFGDFIRPIIDTLDLYHNQGFDPRAIAISFKELTENNPDSELEIVAMERRGENKFLLRAKTAPEADKSQLSAEYFEIYNHVKALAEKEVQALMAEKDNRIRSLENMVHTALQRPSHYPQGDNKVSNLTIQTVSGSVIVCGSVSGNITTGDSNRSNNYTPQQKQTLAEAAAEIQQLLEQLEKSYPTDTTTGKMALATEAIAQIDKNPDLTARILSALKVGSVKAFEQALSHPAASFVIGALEDWQNTKGS